MADKTGRARPALVPPVEHPLLAVARGAVRSGITAAGRICAFFTVVFVFQCLEALGREPGGGIVPEDMGGSKTPLPGFVPACGAAKSANAVFTENPGRRRHG